MIIESPESLKAWLEAYLTPQCDADPQVLAKYCLALVRKDRPEDELKASMLEQLDVFLKEHTTTFVEEFLTVAKDKSYLPKPAKAAPKASQALPKGTSPDSTSQTKVPSEPEAIDSVDPPLPTTIPGSPPGAPTDSPPSNLKKDESARSHKDQDKDERKTKRTSRSRDRSRRSRSRGRSSRSDRRRRSPHSKRYRRSRSRSRSRSPILSNERRSSSPSTKSRPSRHVARSRSPVSNATNTAKSPEKGNEENKSEKPGPEKSLSSVISVPPPTHSSSYGRSQRCRDYDEKGFCMRGDQCPYDHGSDPVVLDGAALDFPPPITGNSSSSLSAYSVPPPSQGTRSVVAVPPPTRTSFTEYTPNNPSLWAEDGDSRNSTPAIPPRFTVPPPDLGRELISVSTDQAKLGLSSSMAKRLGPVAKFNKGPFKPRFGQSDNSTLELRKIPVELNNITELNNHFSKFGNVTNIQVHHDGEPDAALVAFSSHAEANSAYRSAEAVLNNRFIKLFWHNPAKENAQKSVHDRLANRSHPYGFQRPNEGFPGKRDKIIQSRGTIVKTVYNNPSDKDAENKEAVPAAPDSTQPAGASAEEIRKLEIETICKQQELLKAELAAKQKMEKKKLDSIKLKQKLEERSQQLHQKKVEQLKILITKLETNKKNMKPEEISSMMNTIKLLQESISSTKVKALPAKSVQALPPVRSKVQLDKEILDTELELYNVRSDNQDINRLKGRLHQLKVQMAAMKASQNQFAKQTALRGMPTRGHRGGMRGRGRGRPVNIVDRRTTCINASGFEREDKEEVLAHFAGMGSLSDYTWDDQTPSITVQYSTRREAEKAIVDGRNLGDRLLTLTWSRAPERKETSQEPSGPRRNSAGKLETDQSAEETEEITEEIVEIVETVDGDDDSVIFEDEEDEQEETRSWRR